MVYGYTTWKDSNSFIIWLLSFSSFSLFFFFFQANHCMGLNLFTQRFGDMEMAVG